MKEPKLLFCGTREAMGDDGMPEYHIECRFEDGQKRAAVKVDGEFPELATKIAQLLNGSTMIPNDTARRIFNQINTRSADDYPARG